MFLDHDRQIRSSFSLVALVSILDSRKPPLRKRNYKDPCNPSLELREFAEYISIIDVWWGDKGGDAGFSIGAARNMNTPSLVIGGGSGYNLKTNPLPEKAKVRGIFQDQLRAERESFKAVFDKRHVRILTKDD